MNYNAFMGILRALVPAVVAYAVGRGWVTESSAGEIGAAIITIGSAGWSVVSNIQTTPSVGKPAAVIAFALLAFGGINEARAADLTKPAVKANPFTGYVAGGCGMYFGVNTMGSAGYVNGGVPGASIVQGDIGGTLGYGCPIGTTPGNFWFVEGNFDFANVNGGTSGLALTGPAHFEQRIALGSPISSMLSMFPNLSTGLSVPALPALPAGVTAGNVYPFLFASLHEQDISAQVSVDQNRQWLFSPGIGIGMETRLSNGVVAETAAQWILQSNGFGVGPSTVRLGNAAEVSFTLKY